MEIAKAGDVVVVTSYIFDWKTLTTNKLYSRQSISSTNITPTNLTEFNKNSHMLLCAQLEIPNLEGFGVGLIVSL